MAQLGLTAGGALIGAIIGAPFGGALIGAEIGALAGSIVGGVLFGPGTPGLNSPQVGHAKLSTSKYGVPVPMIYGTIRVACEVIAMTNLIAKIEDNTVGGGAGLGGGPGVPAVTTYSLSMTALIGEGPLSQSGAIGGVLRIWADNKKIWDARPGSHKANHRGAAIRVHKGGPSEMPDSWEQKYFGADVCPGYRSYGRVVIEHLQLADFANHPPQVSVEATTKATQLYPYQSVDPGGSTHFSDDIAIDLDQRLLVKYGGAGDVTLIDLDTVEILLGPVTLTDSLVGNGIFGPDGFLYLPQGPPGTNGNYEPWVKVDPRSLTVVQVIGYQSTFDGAFHDGLGVTNVLKNRAGIPYILGVMRVGLPTFSSYGAAIVETGQIAALLDPTSAAANQARFVGKTEASGGPDPACSDWEIDPTTVVIGKPTTFDLWGVLGDLSTTTCHLYRFTVTDNLLPGGGSLVGGANGVNSIVLQETIDISAAWSVVGALVEMTYLDDEHALILSRNGKLIKYNLDSRTVTGAEIAGSTTNSEIVQGPLDGLMAIGGQGSQFVSLLDCTNWEIVQTINLHNFDSSFSLSSQKLEDECTLWLRPSGTKIARLDICSISPGTVTLGEIVADICKRAGLQDADIDVSELTEEVRGYVIARQSSARDALMPLILAFHVIGQEVDGVLKFIHQGKDPVATLQLDDIGAYPDGKQRPQPLTITDADPRTIPRRVTVKYINPGALYQDGLQADQRHIDITTTKKAAELAIDAPVVFHDDEAKAVASTQLWKKWTNARKFDFTTSRAFLQLAGGDVIAVAKDGQTYKMEIQQVDLGADGIIKIPALQDDKNVYITPSINPGGGSGGVTPDPSTKPGHTDFELMDIVLLADSDDGKGFYVAASPDSGDLTAWVGAQLLKSIDNGVSYSVFLTIAIEAVIGRATSVLADAPGGRWDTWDRVNSFTVRLFDSSIAPSSAAEINVLNGANMALLGNEIVQFTTVVDNGDGTFTFSGLLRGIRGSDPFTTTHKLGERFVFLGGVSTAIRDVLVDADFGLARRYKSVSIGADSIPTIFEVFTDTGVRLKPLTAQGPKLTAAGGGDLTISWNRRTRIGGENDLADFVTSVPLGEASESYEVDVLTAPGGTVLRTLSGSSPSLTYTSANQVTDFGSNQTAIAVVIYQKSAVVGRGFGLAATISTI